MVMIYTGGIALAHPYFLASNPGHRYCEEDTRGKRYWIEHGKN